MRMCVLKALRISAAGFPDLLTRGSFSPLNVVGVTAFAMSRERQELSAECQLVLFLCFRFYEMGVPLGVAGRIGPAEERLVSLQAQPA